MKKKKYSVSASGTTDYCHHLGFASTERGARRMIRKWAINNAVPMRGLTGEMYRSAEMPIIITL